MDSNERQVENIIKKRKIERGGLKISEIKARELLKRNDKDKTSAIPRVRRRKALFAIGATVSMLAQADDNL